MISTRRIVTAVGLAAGVLGLAAPMAVAAGTAAPESGRLDPVTALDSLADTGLPAEQRDQVPAVSEQLGGLNQLTSPDGLGQLGRITDLVGPTNGLLPGLGG
ncbi:hypothetical protein ACFYVM_05860 [Streptomyces sp. NPDC003280]|uniref:hypothetical protein n=1 Tax=Streptomyces sp. NPDC003280 TaxID=3364680 RepID=UPI0036A80D28